MHPPLSSVREQSHSVHARRECKGPSSVLSDVTNTTCPPPARAGPGAAGPP